MDDATSPLANPSNPARTKIIDVPENPVIDYVAKAIGDAQDAYKTRLGKDVPMPHGAMFHATIRDIE